LGVNDIQQAGTATTIGYASYGQKIDYFMKSMPKGKPVLWINLPCKIEPPKYLHGCSVVNGALNSATKRWPNLKVFNWAAVANQHAEYIVKNDVHYTPAGRKAISEFIAQKLDAKFPMPK
jgi:hypothetical protein